MCILMPVPYCFDYYTFTSSEIRKCEPSNLVLFQEYLDSLEPFTIPYKSDNQFLHFCKKKAANILIGIVLNL